MRQVALAMVTGSLVAAGCAGLGAKLESPRVSVVGIRALEANLFEQTLEVRMRVQNPNALDIPVRGLDVEVELAEEPFAQGISARQFTVPARGEAEFDMIVTAHAATALLRIATASRQEREQVGYRLKGKLSTKLGMLRSIPFEETGTLPLGELTGKKRAGD
ncbi:MAG TPA: LEA type 2 family protein [Steroidobacteraceae bacterium]|jgi:LEA14-like dessication related protein